MKIRCIDNRNSIPEKFLYEYSSLEVGKEYVVYGLCENDGFSGYIINSTFSAPMWYPYFLFEIVDQRLSRFWIFGFWENSRNPDGPKRHIFSFPEFVNEDYFYTNLVDSESLEDGERVWKILNAYKQLMDLEFPDSSVKEIAQIGDEKWLICPSCMDAWEDSDPRNAMVICPNCKTVQHNPRYKNELPSYLKK